MISHVAPHHLFPEESLTCVRKATERGKQGRSPTFQRHPDKLTLAAKAFGNHSLRIAKSCMIFHDRFREKKLCFLVHHVFITALRPSERGTGRHMTQRTEPP